MKATPFLTLLTAGGLLCSPSARSETNNPDVFLQGMSAKLASAKSFSFDGTRELDPALIPGSQLPEKAKISVSVARPNQINVRSVSRQRTMRFVADGKTLTIFNETKNHYAQAPMRVSIDGLVDKLDKDYGFVPPLADFAVSNPSKEMRQQAHTITYAGREKVSDGFFSSVECDHLTLKGKLANAELWIGAGDQLPRKLEATFHGGSGPQLRINFTAWNLSAPAAASEFQFTPPAGAQKVEMWTTTRMEAAARGKHSASH